MLIEIKTACQFLTNYITPPQVSEGQSKLFGLILSTLLHAKYASHWDLKNPSKGNAYRAITIFNERLDSTIISAAQAANIPNIGKYLPNELCLWIDPNSVSYKIGDYGNVITLYENPENKSYSPRSANSTMMTNNVSSSSSKSSKSSIHGNKHRNSMSDIYVNKGSSQSGRSKKYNNNNNFAMKKNLSSNKENNNNNYPKHSQNSAGGSNKKNESQYHNTSSMNGDLNHKKDHKSKSPKPSYQTKTNPTKTGSTRELSPIAKSLRAQLIAQSRFNIPFLYPKESETAPANNSSSFMNDTSYSKSITMAPQILAN
ncbi:hypothetical protein BCR36DRAFT_96422 [Piromyces finnis]|uniref:Anti-proliferative protein domain-containing protein n=1 Tax=Piromyces finnis TaxID=1754191 RepID=A0A1Y1V5X5_9FUNG|nr:hypothetical protein BCR36DRAFT_96422 [Piromyces finnis]|eukprot:ORX47334.1 hypothetical protein BCR36DRAFT_96422 [Piromyces finnis]